MATINQPGAHLLRENGVSLTYELSTEGRLSCPGLTEEQRAALEAYALEVDKTSKPAPRGASLTVASDEELRLWLAFLETLKTDREKELDRVKAYVQDLCGSGSWLVDGQYATVDWCALAFDEHKSALVQAGDVAQEDTVYNVSASVISANRVYLYPIDCYVVVQAGGSSCSLLWAFCHLSDRPEDDGD